VSAAAPYAVPAGPPVSIVMPCLDDRDLLERNLPPLLAEVDARGVGDEVLVVDDTGESVLADWVAAAFPTVQVVSRPFNGGFAQALLSGVRLAKHELVFCMNPDVRVHEGFLAPLCACLADPAVHSACPRVLLYGDPARIESVTEVAWVEGLLRIVQPGLTGGAACFESGRLEVAYAVGGTCLLRRSEFLAAGGFDPLYEPFYLEDTDLGLVAWRAGWRVLYEPRSVVEHHHRGTIGKRIPRPFVVAVIERNRLLLQWKLIDTPERAVAHFAALHRVAIDALLCEEREPLVWLALALERLSELERSRAALPPAVRGLEELARMKAAPTA
jgi:GT2 family glycosyltransferase